MAIENNLVGRGEKRNHAEMENDDDDEEVEEEEPIQPIQPSSKKKMVSVSEQNAIKIASISSSVSSNLRNKAEKMAQQHIHKLGEAQVGDTVKVLVPCF